MPVLFLTVVIDLIGFGIVIPILPFMSPTFGATKMDIAMIVASYAIFSGLVAPHWGRLSDRIGRKPVILICLAGGALSYVILGFATELWMIYASRMFAGAMAGNFGVASAMVADMTEPEKRAKHMGFLGASFGLGMIVGPMLGGLLAGENENFALPCLVAGSISLLALVAGSLILRETLPAEKRAENARENAGRPRQSVYGMLKGTGNRLVAVQYLLHTSCLATLSYVFPLWTGEYLGWSAKEVGTVLGVQGVLMVIIQSVGIGFMTRQLGELRFLLLSVSIMMAGLLIAAFAGTEPAMLAAFFIAMSGATCCVPLLNSLVSQRSPMHLRGRMMGATSSMSSFGRVLGPLAAGLNLSLLGFPAAWLFSAATAGVFLAWVVREIRLAPPEEVYKH